MQGREDRIKTLEKALEDEKGVQKRIIQEEIEELNRRKSRLVEELQDIEVLIRQKQDALKNSDSAGSDTKVIRDSPMAAVDNEEEKSQHKESTDVNRSILKASIDSNSPSSPIGAKVVPPELIKCRKDEPNSIFIIQRSTVSLDNTFEKYL